MNKDEALRLALEALEEIGLKWPNVLEAIDAIRLVIDVENMASKSTYKEALETKDEPTMWERRPDGKIGPTNAPQRTWVGLTDEEANQLWESTDSDWELMKRIEAKLKEKNT